VGRHEAAEESGDLLRESTPECFLRSILVAAEGVVKLASALAERDRDDQIDRVGDLTGSLVTAVAPGVARRGAMAEIADAHRKRRDR
jgi:hypothetical protein